MTTKAHILMVIDRSGSMLGIQSDAEGGIRAFLDQQRSLADVKTTLSLAQFDHEFEWVHRQTPLTPGISYELQPRGRTALLDAIGTALRHEAEWLDREPPDKVVCVIVTDGRENSSEEWTLPAVSQVVAEWKAAGREVLFLASDLGSIKLGVDVGMASHLYTASGAGTRSAYTASGQSVSDYLSGATQHVDPPAPEQA